METSYLFKIKNKIGIDWYISAKSYCEAEKKYIEYHNEQNIGKIELIDRELIL